MFRRRDEDDPSDAESGGQATLLGGESVKVLSPQEVSSGSTSTAQNAATAYSPAGSPAARTADMPSRLSTSPSSGAYRPVSPQADIGRSRLPENKPSNFGVPAVTAAGSGVRETRRVLTVGADILLKGEIATCDRLVIEGKVDAVLNDVGTVELAESGSFKGIAQVENAEISGLFEGELVVKGRLVIYASGRVRGKITYGEIEIERGGELTGEIKTVAGAGTARSNGRTSEKSGAREEKAAAA